MNRSPDMFRNAMRLFVGGVTLLTTADGGARRGMTATAVCSLSAAPPRLLACVNMSGATYRLMASSRVLTVNLLGAAHEALAARFGGAAPDSDPFDGADWLAGSNGAPRLADAPAAFECAIGELIDAGTHAIVIADVHNVVVAGIARPLIHVNGRFAHVDATDHVPL
jgi:flavin reductase (DIM6/NTAB) family NADH-FMN oxidoreductase RutF